HRRVHAAQCADARGTIEARLPREDPARQPGRHVQAGHARRRGRPTVNAIVALEGLTKDFGDVHAVQGVSLAVEKGEMFGLIGPDGAGKTTTMRMIAGLIPPTGGSVRTCG